MLTPWKQSWWSRRVLARKYRDLAEDALAEGLPWLAWLPETERAACVRELLADLVAGADTALLMPFARNLCNLHRNFLSRLQLSDGSWRWR